MRTFCYLILTSLLMNVSLSFGQQTKVDNKTAAKQSRPPQFVLISFDGSKSHAFWKETLALAAETKSQFSYFISGVYFLNQKDKANYLPPKRKAGASDIGFAENEPSDIEKRTGFIWQALNSKDPMDIGSHVNGHFDGGLWTKEEWTQEFTEFHKLVEKVFTLYPKINQPFAYQWESTLHETIKGFRAPLLAQNIATQQVLKDFNYSYDASQMIKNKWPNLMNTKVWNVGLSRITLLGTKKETVAMDYNVLYGQCDGQFNPKNSGECLTISDSLLKYFENQTYLSYINAFLTSYYGNRAPLSIGHHFSLWNSGIYWKALQKVVIAVCSQPEVKCIAHKSMVQWLNENIDKNGPQFLANLNQGNFDKTTTPQEPRAQLKIDMELLKKVSFEEGFVIPEISKTSEKMMLKGDLPSAHEMEDNDVDLSKFKVSRVTN